MIRYIKTPKNLIGTFESTRDKIYHVVFLGTLMQVSILNRSVLTVVCSVLLIVASVASIPANAKEAQTTDKTVNVPSTVSRSASQSPKIEAKNLERKETYKDNEIQSQIFSDRLDMQDKRLNDFNGLLSQQNNIINILLGVIAFIVAALAFFTYRDSKSAASKKAEVISKKVAQDWFNGEGKELVDNHIKESKERLSQMRRELKERYPLEYGVLQHPSEIPSEAQKELLIGWRQSFLGLDKKDYSSDDCYLAGLACLTISENADGIEALAYFKLAEEKSGSKFERIRAFVAQAITLETKLNKSEEAIKLYEHVEYEFATDHSWQIREWIARSLVAKGRIFTDLGKIKEALCAYEKTVFLFHEKKEPRLLEWVADALIKKGDIFQSNKEFKDAITTYTDVVDRFEKSPWQRLQKNVAKALVNKAGTLSEQEKFIEANNVFNQVTQKFEKYADPDIRQQVATAFVNQGINHCNNNEIDDGECSFLTAVDKFSQDETNNIRTEVARAHNELANLSRQEGEEIDENADNDQDKILNYKKAKEYVGKALQTDGKDEYMIHLAYINWLLGQEEVAKDILKNLLQTINDENQKKILKFVQENYVKSSKASSQVKGFFESLRCIASCRTRADTGVETY